MGDVTKIGKKIFNYEGYFDAKDAKSLVNRSLEDKNYEIDEESYKENALEDEKEVIGIFKAQKKITDYYKLIIKFKIKLNGKEVTLEHEEEQEATNVFEGAFTLEIEYYIEYDHENRYQGTIVEKVFEKIYRKYFDTEEHKKYIKELNDDITTLFYTLGKFFKTEF